jgi:hypothetical protein
MPEKIKIDSSFFTTKKPSVYRVLLEKEPDESGELRYVAHRFSAPGDFAKKINPKNELWRARQWAKSAGVGLRGKVDADGSIVCVAYDLSPEEIQRRQEASHRMVLRKAAEALEKRSAEQSAGQTADMM